jgi:U3 small nucleolar RNA-associated protein 21
MQGTADDGELDINYPKYQCLITPTALGALIAHDTAPDVFSTPPQLDGELITMSLLPRTKWQTLLNLEVIQQRNKPKEPPKPVEQAPFILPTLPGVETRFAPTEKDTQKQEKPTKRLDRSSGGAESVIHTPLSEADSEGDCKLYLELVNEIFI